MMVSSPQAVPPGLSLSAREGLYATGHGLLSQERYRDAAAIFRIMLRVAPTDERGWLGLAECHHQFGHGELAIEILSAGAFAVLDATRCHLMRARFLRLCERTDDAADALEAAIECCTDDDLASLITKERTYLS